MANDAENTKQINDIFENDLMNRKETVAYLSDFINNLEYRPYVISINGSWGSGKTTFVKFMKKYLLIKYNIKNIYFNAWENDFSKEPLISILGELNGYIKDNSTTTKNKFDEVKTIGKKLFKRALPTIIKGATRGAINCDEGFEEAISSLTQSVADELIDSYSEDKKITDEFKKLLGEVLMQIGNKKPFVIFIDELDRCRPLYTIELLERVKHLFNIPKLIFILSIDKENLSKSIQSQYGDIDTNNYLKRFIEFEFSLKNDRENFVKTLLNNQLKKYAKDCDEYNDILDFINSLTNVFNLSLRSIEHVIGKITIFTISKKNIVSSFSIFIVLYLEVLKSCNPKEYYDLLNNGNAKNIILITKEISDRKMYSKFIYAIPIVAKLKKMFLNTNFDIHFISDNNVKIKEIISNYYAQIPNNFKDIDDFIVFLKTTTNIYYTSVRFISDTIDQVEYLDNLAFE
jgi:thymidylate kinase